MRSPKGSSPDHLDGRCAEACSSDGLVASLSADEQLDGFSKKRLADGGQAFEADDDIEHEAAEDGDSGHVKEG